jgi:transcriptional regulator with XRE-family HTH domain
VPPSEPADLALAAAIRRLRETQTWSQEALAHQAGVTVGTVGLIERGTTNPTWTTVKRIAVALDITISELAAKAEDVERQETTWR